MNIILFEPGEITGERLLLANGDSRAIHIREILRSQPGDVLRAGIIGGPVGDATIESISEKGIGLAFTWKETPPPPYPIHLLIGLPRPPTARKILTQCTTQGVAAIHFYQSALGEKSYAQSPLWQTNEWRERIIEGASQARTTHLPDIQRHDWLRNAIEAMPADGLRILLDTSANALPITQRLQARQNAQPLCIAIGPERGWTDTERNTLFEQGYDTAHLGERILRVETAAVSITAIATSMHFAERLAY